MVGRAAGQCRPSVAPSASARAASHCSTHRSRFYELGVPPRRIDIINRADGITFAEAIADGDSFSLQGCEIPVIWRSALIKNKRAAGRPQDIADVKALGDE